jgi:hypothetical protein
MTTIETLRPDPIAITITRGTDCEYTITILGTDGLPKDMSQFAAVQPKIRFRDKIVSLNGDASVFAQALDVTAATQGVCEWLGGGAGGQIHFRLPRNNWSTAWTDSTVGTEDASTTVTSGVWDIYVAAAAFSLAAKGGPSSITNIQRAARGTWSIDRDVTRS